MSKKHTQPAKPLSSRHALGMVAVLAYLGYLTNVHRLFIGPLAHAVLPQVFILALSWYVATQVAQRIWSRIGIALICSSVIALIGISPQLIHWLTYPPIATERIIEKRITFTPGDISSRYGISEAKRLFLVGQSEQEALLHQQVLSFSPFSSRLSIKSNSECRCSYTTLVPPSFGPIYRSYQTGPDITGSKKGDVAVLPFPHIQTQFTTHPRLPTQLISIAVFNGVDQTARLTLRVPTDVCSMSLNAASDSTANVQTTTSTLSPFSHLASKTCTFFSDTVWTYLFEQIWQRTHLADAQNPEVMIDQFLTDAITNQPVSND